MPQASAKQPPSGHPRICSQITGDSALQCWSGCEISPRVHHFYSRPCGRGDVAVTVAPADTVTFLLTPLREGRRLPCGQTRRPAYFYSRPCGRGDTPSLTSPSTVILFLLTPLREGRRKRPTQNPYPSRFLLTPLREGRRRKGDHAGYAELDFYSRPCGRGDFSVSTDAHTAAISTHAPAGGATTSSRFPCRPGNHFYSRPCGRGDSSGASGSGIQCVFLLTPLREGRRRREIVLAYLGPFLLTPLREGRHLDALHGRQRRNISTHAPAGGATQADRPAFLPHF